jgi:hypothetical protein
LIKFQELYLLLNRREVAIIHDRHLSFLGAINECLPNCLNRLDYHHLVLNTLVRSFSAIFFEYFFVEQPIFVSLTQCKQQFSFETEKCEGCRYEVLLRSGLR